MSKLDLWKQRWTRREIAIWLSALILMFTVGGLAVTGVIGAWALVILNVIVVIVGLLRYRMETKRGKR